MICSLLSESPIFIEWTSRATATFFCCTCVMQYEWGTKNLALHAPIHVWSIGNHAILKNKYRCYAIRLREKRRAILQSMLTVSIPQFSSISFASCNHCRLSKSHFVVLFTAFNNSDDVPDKEKPKSFFMRMKCTLVRRGGSYTKSSGFKVNIAVIFYLVIFLTLLLLLWYLLIQIAYV